MKDTPQVGRVLILSGPVAAGKTTVGRLLLSFLRGSWAYLEGDTFWSFIAKAERRSRREKFQIIMRSMTAAAVPFARSGFDVLLDFSIPPDFIATARKILKGIALDFVVLYPSIAICARRAAERSEVKINDYAPYRDFYIAFESTSIASINDDDATAEALATRIRDGLEAGRFRVPALPCNEEPLFKRPNVDAGGHRQT